MYQWFWVSLIRKATIVNPDASSPVCLLASKLVNDYNPGFHQYVDSTVHLSRAVTMNGEENIDLTAKQQSQDQQTSSNRITITVITINGTELEEADLTSQQQSQKLSNNTSVTKNQELDKRKRKLYKCLKILLLSVFAVIGVSVLLVPSMIYYFPLPLVSFSSCFPQLYRWLNNALGCIHRSR